jgi:hypothetical protein
MIPRRWRGARAAPVREWRWGYDETTILRFGSVAVTTKSSQNQPAKASRASGVMALLNNVFFVILLASLGIVGIIALASR